MLPTNQFEDKFYMGKYTYDALGNITKAEYENVIFTKNTEINYPEEIHIDNVTIAKKNIEVTFHSTPKNRDIHINELNITEQNVAITNSDRLLKIEKVLIKFASNSEITEVDTSDYLSITNIICEEYSVRIVGKAYGFDDFTTFHEEEIVIF